MINLIEVQKKLRSLELFEGIIDGINGPLTKRAVISFQLLHPPLDTDGIVGRLTEIELFEKSIGDRKLYSDEDRIKKYGKPGENLRVVNLPYAMVLAWDVNRPILRFAAHNTIIRQVESLFSEILCVYGLGKIQELGLNKFGGCYNNRVMRGGTSLSSHAWGLSIDIDPVNNRLPWGKDKAKLATPDYDKFWKIVKDNGGRSMGLEKGYDYMHIQWMDIC